MRTIILLVFMLACATVQAQNSEFNRFRLYSACSPVHLLVESLSKDATDIGLTKEDIITTVRSRLRGARIYTSEQKFPQLYVNVGVAGRAFSFSVELAKFVSDLETDLIYPATTWQTGGGGTHGNDPGYILQGIGQYIDRFIDEYLAINESACE